MDTLTDNSRGNYFWCLHPDCLTSVEFFKSQEELDKHYEEYHKDETDDEDSCDMATGGMIGTIGMWAGIICALMVTLTLVLPMAGVDAMDAVPEMGNKIATWGAGALMLVGMLGWYMMLPDGGDMSLGMSGWMAGAAMSMGLGSALIGQFIEADE